MAMKRWVRLPSTWINQMKLREFGWGPAGGGSSDTAALMTLTAIAHNADEKHGVARLTYDDFYDTTGLSRLKISKGLDALEALGVIQRAHDRRSTYRLSSYSPEAGGWAKFPARGMYNAAGTIVAFKDFRLRSKAELDALKLFFLFVARRGQDTNMANISYEKIQEYTGIERARIKTGVSLLATHSLIYVEQLPSSSNEHGISNAYRIIGIDPYAHQGTRGRAGL
jgi:hypothetical protein